jgi:hypothetical protein
MHFDTKNYLKSNRYRNKKIKIKKGQTMVKDAGPSHRSAPAKLL